MTEKPCQIEIVGDAPRVPGLTRTQLREAARYFARRSGQRIRTSFRAVSVILQTDAASAEVHRAIMGIEGPTDVITQRYDAMPGEEPGVYGELYVNVMQARRYVAQHPNGTIAREVLLYVAHGMDHLSGADDALERGYDAMRRREWAWLRQFSSQRKRNKKEIKR